MAAALSLGAIGALRLDAVRVEVQLVVVDREARVAELARMLGGAEKTARKHAEELLDAG